MHDLRARLYMSMQQMTQLFSCMHLHIVSIVDLAMLYDCTQNAHWVTVCFGRCSLYADVSNCMAISILIKRLTV